MSDLMLHGVLNMPLTDDPADLDVLTWMQFKQRARQASDRIEELEADLTYWKADSAAAWDKCEENRLKLAKAVEALDEAVYLLAPNEKDMMRQAGVYRIVTTLAELSSDSCAITKGEQDE